MLLTLLHLAETSIGYLRGPMQGLHTSQMLRRRGEAILLMLLLRRKQVQLLELLRELSVLVERLSLLL